MGSRFYCGFYSFRRDFRGGVGKAPANTEIVLTSGVCLIYYWLLFRLCISAHDVFLECIISLENAMHYHCNYAFLNNNNDDLFVFF